MTYTYQRFFETDQSVISQSLKYSNKTYF